MCGARISASSPWTSSLERRLRFRHHTIRPRPAETILGACARPVFAGDPIGPAEPVERLEDLRMMDFALVRLVARRHRSDLDVTDQRLVLLEAADQMPLHDLHVIEVEL